MPPYCIHISTNILRQIGTQLNILTLINAYTHKRWALVVQRFQNFCKLKLVVILIILSSIFMHRQTDNVVDLHMFGEALMMGNESLLLVFSEIR